MEILFYHLQNTTLEQTLPSLLDKTLARGWKAVVRVSSDERMKALPHSVDADAQRAAQPIVLSRSDTRFNDAEVIFAVDGAALPETEGWTRAVLMFDGNDPEALDHARAAWKSVKASGSEATYWRQDESGRWAKMA
jgi:DNA polymerase III subunit chi